MASLQLLAIKPKTWRDLVNDEPFKREDIITIQDPQNLAARDLREYDYVKKDLKVSGVSFFFFVFALRWVWFLGGKFADGFFVI